MKKKVIDFDLMDKNLSKIEFLVEEVCNDLNINDSFFGNILLSVLSTVNCLRACEGENRLGKIRVEAKKEKTKIKFSFNATKDIISAGCLEKNDHIDDRNKKSENTSFIIEKLTDNFIREKRNISLIFDIGEHNNPLMKTRSEKIENFQKKEKQKV